MNQIPSYNTLLIYNVIPAKSCVLCCEYPIGILGMELSQAVLIALRETLLIEVFLKGSIGGVDHRLPDIVASRLALSA